MLCYLNRGLVLEQAICSLISDYFRSLRLENTYQNFHVSVTTDHPFARLYLNKGLNAADSFPCVVVATQEERKPFEFDGMQPNEAYGIGITDDDLDSILQTTQTFTNKKGAVKTKEIAGLCTIADAEAVKAVRAVIKKQGGCYGYSVRTRRQDSIGLDIWAENVQLKNELYEQLRLYVTGSLRHELENAYPFFDIAIFDETVVGMRSNNYNFDFDVALSGAHISFDVQYCVEQVVLNTELTGITGNIITEALNNVYSKKDE